MEDVPVSQSTIKWRKTMIKKYGSLEKLREHQAENGSKGGKNKTGKTGLALLSPERRAEIAKMGGTLSKRTK